MDIISYRLIRLKSINCDTLLNIHNQKTKQDSINIENCHQMISFKKLKINSLNETLDRKDAVIDTLNQNLQKSVVLMDGMEPKKHWIKRNSTWFALLGGLLGGLIL